MFKELTRLLKQLVDLAQERNNLALESLSELRDIHKILREEERDGDEQLAEEQKQTALLTAIAAELVTPPSVAETVVITFGKQIPQ